MSETPETDAAECDCAEFYDIGLIPGKDSGPSGYVPIEVARKLERERNAYAQTLMDIANAEGPIITENVFVRHPELAAWRPPGQMKPI